MEKSSHGQEKIPTLRKKIFHIWKKIPTVRKKFPHSIIHFPQLAEGLVDLTLT
jgi:hypothetical protein